MERAEMRQAVRLLELPADAVTEAAVRTFLPEDLELPEGAGALSLRVLRLCAADPAHSSECAPGGLIGRSAPSGPTVFLPSRGPFSLQTEI